MAPAEQTLETEDATACQLVLRLVLETKFPAIERVTEGGGDPHPLGRHGVHQRGVEADRIAPLSLGGEHRRVGVLHERLGVQGVVGEDAGADAGPDRDRVARDQERRAQGAAHFFRERAEVVAPRQLGKNQSELVAGQACHGVARPHQRSEPVRDAAEQKVAHVMTERVVDHLEPVDVQEKETQGMPVTTRPHQLLLETVEEQSPVREVGQAVPMGEIPEPALGSLARHRITQGVHQRLAVDSSLDQIVLGSGRQRLIGERRIAVAGQHHQGNVGGRLSDPGDRLQTVGIRQARVEKDRVESSGFNLGKRLAQPWRAGDGELGLAGLAEQLADDQRILGIVLDDENFNHPRTRARTEAHAAQCGVWRLQALETIGRSTYAPGSDARLEQPSLSISGVRRPSGVLSSGGSIE